MIDFPSSTKVNRFIPKDKFYSKTKMSAKLRKHFTDEVEKITWTNKISPETLNISAKEFAELQVFEILLKSEEISTAVLRHIDTFIPYPILFIFKKADAQKAVISYKEASIKNQESMKVASYFETVWQQDLKLELKGRSVDEIYENYIYQVAPELQGGHGYNIKIAIEKSKANKSVQAQIEALNKKISSEPSIAKKQDLAKQRFVLEQLIEDL